MAIPSDYVSGTISLQNGEATFTGTGTGWLAAAFREGDILIDIAGAENLFAVIGSIDSNTSGTLSKPWSGPDLTDVAYRMRYAWDSARVGAQARSLVEMLGNGNLQALSALSGPGVPVFDGPHTMVIKPEADFVNGVSYDVQVNNLAGRAAYDARPVPFAVLVSDNGDGRAALYSKLSNASGDWSAPSFITGPVGPAPVITAEVESTAPGTPAAVNVTPIAGGYNLDFGLPAAEGMQPRGPWSSATAYVKGDVVSNSGSSYVAKRANTNVPPGENADWGLLAAKGTDGAGAGDVMGPAGAVSGAVAGFDGTTGKLLKALTAADVWTFLKANATVLADLKWLTVPIGGLIAVPNLPGNDTPPTDNALYRYAKLTASDSYNTGILGSQSVTGSGALVQATAAITLAGSPMNGQTLRLINTERRFLRAGAANTVQNDALQDHAHWAQGKNDAYKHTFNVYPIATTYGMNFAASGFADPNIAKSGLIHTDNAARWDNDETRVKNLGVDYYMRIR